MLCFCVLVAQSCLTLCDPRTAACKAPLSLGFSKQDYLSEWPLPSPGDLPSLGIEPRSPAVLVYSLPSEKPGRPLLCFTGLYYYSLCTILLVF